MQGSVFCSAGDKSLERLTGFGDQQRALAHITAGRQLWSSFAKEAKFLFAKLDALGIGILCWRSHKSIHSNHY
jgi:hypothetical protein